jgi:hypothetical protein
VVIPEITVADKAPAQSDNPLIDAQKPLYEVKLDIDAHSFPFASVKRSAEIVAGLARNRNHLAPSQGCTPAKDTLISATDGDGDRLEGFMPVGIEHTSVFFGCPRLTMTVCRRLRSHLDPRCARCPALLVLPGTIGIGCHIRRTSGSYVVSHGVFPLVICAALLVEFLRMPASGEHLAALGAGRPIDPAHEPLGTETLP